MAWFVLELVCRYNYFFLGELYDYSIALLGKNVHPVTVATFSDQLCHLEPKSTVTNLGQT